MKSIDGTFILLTEVRARKKKVTDSREYIASHLTNTQLHIIADKVHKP